MSAFDQRERQMTPAHTIHIHPRTKWGRMAKTIVERVQGLFGGKGLRAIPIEQVTPQRLASDPLITVQLSEEQSEQVRELEEHGPTAR